MANNLVIYSLSFVGTQIKCSTSPQRLSPAWWPKLDVADGLPKRCSLTLSSSHVNFGFHIGFPQLLPCASFCKSLKTWQ